MSIMATTEATNSSILSNYPKPRPPDSRPLPPPGSSHKFESKRPRFDENGFLGTSLDREQQTALDLLEKLLQSTLELESTVWNLADVPSVPETSQAHVRLFRGAKGPIDLAFKVEKHLRPQKKVKPSKPGSDSDESDEKETNARLAAVCSELDPTTSRFFASAFKKSTSGS